MSGQQIGMGFVSPEVESHTFEKYLGAWSSGRDHVGEIHTVDGRTIAVAARLALDGHITALADGATLNIPPVANWHFRGDTLAAVISSVSLGMKPALFAANEERLRAKARTDKKNSARSARELVRDLNKNVDGAGPAPHPLRGVRETD